MKAPGPERTRDPGRALGPMAERASVPAHGPFRPADDPILPSAAGGIRIAVDGEPVDGIAGQTIAGILLAGGRISWRRSRGGRPRGVFCGIGTCFDCLVVVNGLRDVRACRRRAADGDRVELQGDDHGDGVELQRGGDGDRGELRRDGRGELERDDHG